GPNAGMPLAIGLAEMAALFFPGRLALRRGELVSMLSSATSPCAYGPRELRSALLELARRFHGQEEDVLRIAAAGYTRAWRALSASDERAAARLQLALGILDRPSTWNRGDETPVDPLVSPRSQPSLGAIEDGRLVAFARDMMPLEDALEAARPRAAKECE